MEPGEWMGSDFESPKSDRFVGMTRTEALRTADDEDMAEVRVMEVGWSAT